MYLWHEPSSHKAYKEKETYPRIYHANWDTWPREAKSLFPQSCYITVLLWHKFILQWVYSKNSQDEPKTGEFIAFREKDSKTWVWNTALYQNVVLGFFKQNTFIVGRLFDQQTSNHRLRTFNSWPLTWSLTFDPRPLT